MVKQDDKFEGELLKTHAGAKTAYARGYKFEVRVRDALRKAGWWVHRMHQSRGAMDLIATRAVFGEFQPKCWVIFVQCKASGEPKDVGVDEWNRLLHEAKSAGAIPLIAVPGAGEHLSFGRIETPAKRNEPRQHSWWNAA